MKKITQKCTLHPILYLRKSLAVIIMIICCSMLQGQSHFDCIDAIEVCNNDTLNIKYAQADGMIDEGVTDFCSMDLLFSSNELLEESTVWMKYQFNTPGSFIFKIIPEHIFNDIDFVVFSSENKNCDDLNPIRCMFSGPSGNGDTSCLGATGLSASSMDVAEGPNCEGGVDKDNFLAPIEVSLGEVLYLAISSFSRVVDYELTHSGTASIGCLNSVLKNQYSDIISVYPNPFDNELSIESITDKEVESIVIYDLVGNRLLTRKVNSTRCTLDLSDLDAGIYIVQMEYNSRNVIKKIIKSH